MPKFKPGDKVVCIQPGFSGFLKSGQCYFVREIRDPLEETPLVYLISIPDHGFWETRFKLAGSKDTLDNWE